MSPLLGHQGGWDEFLLFAVPIVAAVLLVRWIEKRGRRSGSDGEAGSVRPMNARDVDTELRERLSALQWHVTQEAGTEPAFSGEYWDLHDDGRYRCLVCDQPLFVSDTKYDSGTGWPSFFEPVTDTAVATREDRSHGMVRTEVVCGNCGAHLGHLFEDGPNPTGHRYCMNSASLRFEAEDDA